MKISAFAHADTIRSDVARHRCCHNAWKVPLFWLLPVFTLKVYIFATHNKGCDNQLWLCCVIHLIPPPVSVLLACLHQMGNGFWAEYQPRNQSQSIKMLSKYINYLHSWWREKNNEISSFYFCGADVAWHAWMLAPIWLDIMTTDRWRE